MNRLLRHAVCVLAGAALVAALPVAAVASAAASAGSGHGPAAVSVAGQLNAVARVSRRDIWAVGCSGACTGPHTLIMHWDGSAWSTVPSPDPGALVDTLTGITAVSARDIWAVGYDCGPICGADQKTLILHWNGARWSVVPSPDPGASGDALSSVSAVSAADIWAAGTQTDPSTGVLETLLLHWNGARWSAVSSPNVSGNANQLYSVSAASPTDAWAVGDQCASGGCPVPLITTDSLILHWNGRRWSRVSSPDPGTRFNGLFAVTALSARNAWAVGNTSDGNGSQTLVAHWNGAAWSRVASPHPGGDSLDAVSAASSGDIWAVGNQFGASLPYLTLTEKWNGSAWSAVPSPNGTTSGVTNFLAGITAISPRDAVAVGWSSTSGTSNRVLILRWNGSTWSIQ